MRPIGGVSRAALLRESERSQWPRLAAGRYPGLPFVVLTLVLLVSGLCGAIFCMLPADADALLYGAAATTLLLVAAVLVWFVGPRVPNGWGLDAGLAVPGLVVVGAASVAMSPQAQVLVALAMMLFGIVAAYFRPLLRCIAFVIAMLIVYGLALVANPLLNPVYFAVVAMFTCAVSGVVAVLVTQLRAQAVTDGLTGVLNRRGLLAVSAFINADLLRGHGPVSVAIIDVDDFKAYNDAHGHFAGDQVLVGLARKLQEGLRGSDVIARFGGDEFALVLRGVTQQEATTVLSRIADRSAKTTWSMGVAQWLPGQSLEMALANADRKMYAAKRTR